MRRDLFRLVVAALIVLPLAGHADATDDYGYSYPLHTTVPSDAYRIRLNAEIYARSQPSAGLRDMVVVNAAGQEVPFAPMPPESSSAHPFTLTTQLFPVPPGGNAKNAAGRSAGDDDKTRAAAKATNGQAMRTTEWLLDAGRIVTLKRIELRLPASIGDVALRLDLESSNELQHWSERESGIAIVRITRGAQSVNRHTINLSSPESARYYRVRLIGGKVSWSPAEKLGAVLTGSYVEAGRPASLQWLSVPAEASSNRNGEFDYRLPAALPVRAVRVLLAGRNTTAGFEFSAGDGRRTPLGNLTAVRMAGGGGSNEILHVTAGRIASLHLHTDATLTGAPRLQVAWQPATFVFLSNGPAPYRLLVGSYQARRASYPMEPALRQLRGKLGNDWQPPLAELGNGATAAGPAALKPPEAPFDWTRVLLWCVLIVATLLVAGMALSLLRRKPRNDAR